MLGDKTIHIIEENVASDFKRELLDQGHHLTGALENSVRSLLKHNSSSVAVEFFANDYIDPLNDGVPPENVPYDSSQRTGAKSSKYIEGLKNYAMLRFGLTNEKEALSAAFAIAKTHEKEGMPSRGSYVYASNGSRTQSLARTLSENNAKYEAVIDRTISQEIDTELDQNFKVLNI